MGGDAAPLGEVAPSDFRHDTRHAAGTILLLVDALRSSAEGRLDDSVELSAITECANAIAVMMDATAPRIPTRLDLVLHKVMTETRTVFAGGLLLDTRPATVFAQPSDVRRVIVNLVENAYRAAGPGGDVSVRVSTPHQSVMFAVEDSGPGLVDAEEHDGRGLKIVSRVVSELGGDVSFGASAALGGASVVVTLPAASQ